MTKKQLLKNSFKKRLSVGIPWDTRAIYFLIHNKKIVYIGQTINLQNRLKSHKKGKRSRLQPKKIFDSFSFILTNPFWDNETIDNIEAFHILKHKPKYNVRIPKNTFTKNTYLKDLK